MEHLPDQLAWQRAVLVGYRHFRADGWPLCPRCDEDELWSPDIPATVDTIAGCYCCHWKPATSQWTPRLRIERDETHLHTPDQIRQLEQLPPANTGGVIHLTTAKRAPWWRRLARWLTAPPKRKPVPHDWPEPPPPPAPPRREETR